MSITTNDSSDEREKHTICRTRVEPSTPFDLYECKFKGKWVGVTDCLYADVINGLWMEGYHCSVEALDNGKIQVTIEETLCENERCIEEYEEHLKEVYNE